MENIFGIKGDSEAVEELTKEIQRIALNAASDIYTKCEGKGILLDSESRKEISSYFENIL